MRKYRLRGQSLMEYTVLAACIAAALWGMQHYIKRSVQGKVKQAADEVSEPYDSEDIVCSTITTKVDSLTVINQTVLPLPTNSSRFYIESNISINESVNRTGNEQLGAW
jgi:hypothetical protein